MCVASFISILIENQVHAVVFFFIFQFHQQNFISAVPFSCVIRSFWTLSDYIESLKTDILKSSCQSLKMTSLSAAIN